MSNFYPHGDVKIEEMLRFVSRGKRPFADYTLGTMDEAEYLHFLDASLQVMQGKTYAPNGTNGNNANGSSSSSSSSNSKKGGGFLPNLASNTQMREVASELPRSRQKELVENLRGIEKNIESAATTAAAAAGKKKNRMAQQAVKPKLNAPQNSSKANGSRFQDSSHISSTSSIHFFNSYS